MAATVEVGMVAEYTCDETWGADAGMVLTGDVVKAGVTYADIRWRESGRTQRVHLRGDRRSRHELIGIVFRAETEQETDALHREFSHATYLTLCRMTERRRIEVEHDEHAGLVHEGRRTSAWYRTVAAVLNARIVEVDQMVAALRPGDRVRQADDETAKVWTVREVHDGNDGWVWLSLRHVREDGSQVWTGCRARAVDLVEAGTDDQYTAEREAKLRDDHRARLLTDDEYTARLQQLHTGIAPAAPDSEEITAVTELDPPTPSDVPDTTSAPAAPSDGKPFVRVFKENGTGNVIIALDAEAMDGLLTILDAADLKEMSQNPSYLGMNPDEGDLASTVGYDILGQLRKLDRHF